MNKPDSTGESLESILASIRRSLAEQSTGVLEDEPATPPTLLPAETDTADDADVPRLFGGPGVASSDVSNGERVSLVRLEDDPPPPASILARPPVPQEPPIPAPALATTTPVSLDEPPPPALAPLADAPPPKGTSRDPFWFLSGRGGAEKKDAAAPVGTPEDAPRPAAPAAKAPIPDPKPMRTDIVRGPLPPFFGSSAEAVKVDPSPAPGVSAGAGMVPPAPASAGLPSALDRDPLRNVPAETPRTPAWPNGMAASPPPSASPDDPLPAAPLMPPAAREGLLNGKDSFLAPPPAAPIPDLAPAVGIADALPHVRGLEAMVAELLRPMLRRWLDENMPRLVSAALKAEADLISRRDPKKP